MAEPLPQGTIPGWGLAAIGLAAGLAIAGIAALVVQRIRHKPSAPDRLPATAPGSFWGSRPPFPSWWKSSTSREPARANRTAFTSPPPVGGCWR